MTTKDELRALASKATQGAWENANGFVRAKNQGSRGMTAEGVTITTMCAWVAECMKGEAFHNGAANAAYIAAAFTPFSVYSFASSSSPRYAR